MAAKSRADLYPRFETGDKPTQDDFKDDIDSCFNLVDDKVTLNMIDNSTVQAIVNMSSNNNWGQTDW